MKRFLLVLFLALCLPAFVSSSGFNTLADITGTGAVVQISANPVRCSWVQVIADSANSAAIRFGDSATSSTRGLKIAAGGGYNTPVVPGDPYSLSQFYVYVGNNDKVYVSYGN